MIPSPWIILAVALAFAGVTAGWVNAEFNIGNLERSAITMQNDHQAAIIKAHEERDAARQQIEKDAQKIAADRQARELQYEEGRKINEDDTQRTIAAYRSGTLRLRDNLATCHAEQRISLSDSGTLKRTGDDAGRLETERGNVEFLVRYSGKAESVVEQLRLCQTEARDNQRICGVKK